MAHSPLRKSNEEFDHNASWQYEEVGELYDARRFQSWTGRRFHDAESRVIRRLLSTANSLCAIKTVMDLPCGTGRISQIPAEMGFDLTCADISEPMLRAARKRLESLGYSSDYQIADIYNLPFEDNHFDCITCIRLFQHLNEEQTLSALRELHRVTARYVVANVMYADGWYALTRTLRQKFGRYAPRYTIDKAVLARIEQETGLVIRETALPQPLHNGNMVILFEKAL